MVILVDNCHCLFSPLASGEEGVKEMREQYTSEDTAELRYSRS